MKRRSWWVLRTVISLVVGVGLLALGVAALASGDRIGILFLIFGVPLLAGGLVRLWVLRRFPAAEVVEENRDPAR